MENKKKNQEQFSISFLSFKFEAVNPGKRTVTILCLILTFFVMMVALFKYQILLAGLQKMKTLFLKNEIKIGLIIKYLKERSHS